VQVVLELIAAATTANLQAATQPPPSRPPEDEAGDDQRQQGDGAEQQDQAAPGAFVAEGEVEAVDLGRLGEEPDVAGHPIAAERALVKVGDEGHHPVFAVDAAQHAAAGVVDPSDLAFFGQHLPGAAVADDGGAGEVEGGEVVVDRGQRFARADQGGAGIVLIEARLGDLLDLRREQQHRAGEDDDEQQQPEREGAPAVGLGENQTRAPAGSTRGAGGPRRLGGGRGEGEIGHERTYLRAGLLGCPNRRTTGTLPKSEPTRRI